MLFDQPEPHGFCLAKKAVAFFQDVPLLLENAVLSSKPLVTTGKFQVFFRNNFPITPLVHANMHRRAVDAS